MIKRKDQNPSCNKYINGRLFKAESQGKEAKRAV